MGYQILSTLGISEAQDLDLNKLETKTKCNLNIF